MTETSFASEWLEGLLAAIDQQLPPAQKGCLFENCALTHFRALNMAEVIAPYTGDLPAFLHFLNETWHWAIDYDPAAGVILADEGKPTCVCPIVQAGLVKNSPGLCNCSERFAEHMFSVVLQQPVRAKVVTSILRGDATCKYAIQILTSA